MKTTAIVALMLFAGCLTASAQYTNKSSVLDGSGTISTGGSFTNISAAGQPGGIGVSSGGSFQNQAGFLNTFLLKPSLDTDGDGIPDEIDTDNDNDGIPDFLEIAGTGFAPVSPTFVNVADSDGDGIPDGAESVAGTDPNNASAVMKITSITNSAGVKFVAWVARGNNERTYLLRTTANAGQPYGQIIFSNTVAGGNSPWYVVTNSLGDAAASNALFYAVEVKP